jgi:hypothetical protein
LSWEINKLIKIKIVSIARKTWNLDREFGINTTKPKTQTTKLDLEEIEINITHDPA